MKNIFLLVLLIAIKSFSQTPAWFWSNPLPQGNDLNSISFVDQNNAFIFGNYGTMLKSGDGGNTWQFLQPFRPKKLSSVYFVNQNIGYGVGDNGLIIKTTNGGNSWITQTTNVDTNLSDIFFIDENYGYAVGDWGLVLKTTNGGINWSSQSFYYNNKKVFFIDSSNGFICGDAGTLLRTTNGGTNWFSIFLGTTADLRDIRFISSQTGFAVGGYYSSGLIYKTTDGGANWTNTVGPGVNGLFGIFFRDSLTGFAVGYDRTLLKTTDGGNSWSNISLSSATGIDFLKGVFKDANTGFIISSGGIIYKTTDGGLNWFKSTTGNNNFLYSSHFLNSQFGFVVGANKTILKTTNGGISWSEKTLNLIANPAIMDIHIFNSNDAIAVGSFGFYHITSDGGETWNSFSGLNANDLVRLKFPNNNIGYAVGYWGTVIKSTNGGLNWNFSNSGISNSIFLFDTDFLNADTGFVCGSAGTILKTTNGGSSWNSINTGTTTWLRGMDFWENNLGLAVGDGGLILRTTDGGVSWDSLSGGQFRNLHSVKFVSLLNAIAVGDSGKIFLSSDSGLSWDEQISSTDNLLFNVNIVDTTTFFVVGDKGTILKTISGGIPVELTSFAANVLENSVTLEWSTATELNNSGFEIQRKSDNDNNNWKSVGFVKGNGTTTEPHKYLFEDKNLSSGSYQYRLKQIDFDGTFEYSEIIQVEIDLPAKFELFQNYPNPFNPSTKIRFVIPNEVRNLEDFSSQTLLNDNTFVTLKVYDILGNEVATLVNEKKPAGVYEVEFDAIKLSSGIYFYKLQAGSFLETKKMILIK